MITERLTARYVYLVDHFLTVMPTLGRHYGVPGTPCRNDTRNDRPTYPPGETTMQRVEYLPIIMAGRCLWRTGVREQQPGRAFRRYHHDGSVRLPHDGAIRRAVAAWQDHDATV
jgi:hypothetical protein